jgi:hypothetical protein
MLKTFNQEEQPMRYMMMVYSSEAEWANATQEALMKLIEEFGAFHAEIAERDILIAERLHQTPTATTVRVRDGKRVITDGPFAETKEQLGGVYVFECRDLDDAIDIASKIPTARFGSIEIRPVFLPPDEGEM